jgi:hypothetical protein
MLQEKPNKPYPSKASLKLIVYFKNGEARKFYNYHSVWNSELKKPVLDEMTGLKKLERLVEVKFKEKYNTALIYHIDSGKQIRKYVYDKQIQCYPLFPVWENDKIKIRLGTLQNPE